MNCRWPVTSIAGILGLTACTLTGGNGGGLPAGGVSGQAEAPRAGMAPSDQGDARTHHDFVVNGAGGASVFVWVPRFNAIQVRRSTGELPRGAWIKEIRSGHEGHDWIRQTFGGFYVGKYEASKGSSGHPVVAQNAVPWADVEWEHARELSEGIVPGKSHLLRGDEWTAMAVWATIHGIDVRGNTKYGVDGLDPGIVFDTATPLGAARTGTGRRAEWTKIQNLTSHTGDAAGVFDLVGNLREWDGAVMIRGSEYLIDGIPTGIGGTAPGYVASLHTDPFLRVHGLVASTTVRAEVPYFQLDAYHVAGHPAPGSGRGTDHEPTRANQFSEFRTNRGGTYVDGHAGEVAQAGMWLLCINREPGYRAPDQGFRPALRF